MKCFLSLLILAFAGSAFAQAATPCDSLTGSGLCLSWQAPVPVTGVTVASYSVYQIPLSGSTCAQFTPSTTNRIAVGVTTLFYLQTGYSKAPVCNEVTAVSSAGVEGPASAVNQFQLQIPGTPQAVSAIMK